jgi:hypothetical protein
MAAATNVWVPGFSENPAGQPLVAGTIIEMLNLVGDEIVPPPAGAGGAPSGDAPTRAASLRRDRSPLAQYIVPKADAPAYLPFQPAQLIYHRWVDQPCPYLRQQPHSTGPQLPSATAPTWHQLYHLV